MICEVKKVSMKKLILFWCVNLIACVWLAPAMGAAGGEQETIPVAPSDHTLIYTAAPTGELTPLSYEAATTKLQPDVMAKNSKRDALVFTGGKSATTLSSATPRFYLFVPANAQQMHPPLIVRLNAKNNARRVAALMEKNSRGIVIPSEEIIKPRYRVLGKAGEMLYLEVRPDAPLASTEYAFIGANLQRVATFRISDK